ncbi:hypothetical protein [uncultured Methylobacterium sp.]|uniref:hypothetical protein n=1 Tax=uncultured Methylobacterium sp. TaxID=157278 RepID=UPI0035C9B377
MKGRALGAYRILAAIAAEGGVATTLLPVQLPGIGTVMPGERLNERTKPHAGRRQDVRVRT